MNEALLSVSPTDEMPVNGEVHARQELTRVIEARLVQGYKVESLDETRAVLVVKGHKRLFGLRAGLDKRTELTIGEHGRVTTRNL